MVRKNDDYLPDDLHIFPVLAFAVPPFAVHDGSIHVSGGKCVGFIQQRDHTQQNGPGRKHGGERPFKIKIKIRLHGHLILLHFVIIVFF